MNTSTCFANHVLEEIVYAQQISLPTEDDKRKNNTISKRKGRIP